MTVVLGATGYRGMAVVGMLQYGIKGTNTRNKVLDSCVDSTEHKFLFYKETTRM